MSGLSAGFGLIPVGAPGFEPGPLVPRLVQPSGDGWTDVAGCGLRPRLAGHSRPPCPHGSVSSVRNDWALRPVRNSARSLNRLSQRSAQQAPGDYSAGRDQPDDHRLGDSRRIELPGVSEETREAHGREQTPPPEGEANEKTSADKHREADHVQLHVGSTFLVVPGSAPGRRERPQHEQRETDKGRDDGRSG